MLPESSLPDCQPKSALVVIDMQRALFDGPDRPHDGDFIVRRLCALVDRARREEVQIVFVQHCSEAHPKGSPGWRLIEPLQPRFPDWVIAKDRPGIFHGTNLSAQLKAVGITRLILAGARTDHGIDTSCRVAAELGFEVVLAADAHTTIDNDALPAAAIIAHHNATLGGPFATVMAAEAVAL